MAIGFSSCGDEEIGYLTVEGAGYLPDTLLVKTVLDETEDATRIKYKTPWFSTEIQGIEGTSPISYSISDVKTEDGQIESVFSNVEVKGIGIIYIPYENSLEPGRYDLTMKVSNVNGDKFIEDVFTLVVE